MEMTTIKKENRLKECQKESQKTIVTGETFFVIANVYNFDYKKVHSAISELSSKGYGNDGIYNYFATSKYLENNFHNKH